MTVFKVPDKYSLGEAIWGSMPGDTIEIKSGDYGRIIIKGCNVDFSKDHRATAQQIIGVDGNCKVTNWKQQDNIKSIFVFRKILPFKLGLQQNEKFFHPTGTEIILMGHDKETVTFSGNKALTASEQLPRSTVDVIVPWLGEIDFDILESDFDLMNVDLIQRRFTEEQKLRNLLNGHGSRFSFGEVEYIALWSLNHFIRQYSKIAHLRGQKGFSFAAFRDGLFTGYSRPPLSSDIKLLHQQYVDQYTSALLDNKQKQELSDSCLSSPDYSIAEYIQDNLNHLNYSMAAVGMAQFLESITGAGKVKWKAIKNCSLSTNAKKYLAEIICARDVILHQKNVQSNKILIVSKKLRRILGLLLFLNTIYMSQKDLGIGTMKV